MRREVAKYCNDNLHLLNLKQWTIKVSEDLPPDDAWADVEVSENLWEATIRISNDFFKETPESQRRILSHELMHVHNAGLERFINSLEGILGSQTFDLLNKAWDTETERVAEALSHVVCSLLPVPELTLTKVLKKKETGARRPRP